MGIQCCLHILVEINDHKKRTMNLHHSPSLSLPPYTPTVPSCSFVFRAVDHGPCAAHTSHPQLCFLSIQPPAHPISGGAGMNYSSFQDSRSFSIHPHCLEYEYSLYKSDTWFTMSSSCRRLVGRSEMAAPYYYSFVIMWRIWHVLCCFITILVLTKGCWNYKMISSRNFVALLQSFIDWLWHNGRSGSVLPSSPLLLHQSNPPPFYATCLWLCLSQHCKGSSNMYNFRTLSWLDV